MATAVQNKPAERTSERTMPPVEEMPDRTKGGDVLPEPAPAETVSKPEPEIPDDWTPGMRENYQEYLAVRGTKPVLDPVLFEQKYFRDHVAAREKSKEVPAKQKKIRYPVTWKAGDVAGYHRWAAFRRDHGLSDSIEDYEQALRDGEATAMLASQARATEEVTREDEDEDEVVTAEERAQRQTRQEHDLASEDWAIVSSLSATYGTVLPSAEEFAAMRADPHWRENAEAIAHTWMAAIERQQAGFGRDLSAGPARWLRITMLIELLADIYGDDPEKGLIVAKANPELTNTTDTAERLHRAISERRRQTIPRDQLSLDEALTAEGPASEVVTPVDTAAGMGSEDETAAVEASYLASITERPRTEAAGAEAGVHEKELINAAFHGLPMGGPEEEIIRDLAVITPVGPEEEDETPATAEPMTASAMLEANIAGRGGELKANSAFLFFVAITRVEAGESVDDVVDWLDDRGALCERATPAETHEETPGEAGPAEAAITADAGLAEAVVKLNIAEQILAKLAERKLVLADDGVAREIFRTMCAAMEDDPIPPIETAVLSLIDLKAVRPVTEEEAAEGAPSTGDILKEARALLPEPPRVPTSADAMLQASLERSHDSVEDLTREPETAEPELPEEGEVHETPSGPPALGTVTNAEREEPTVAEEAPAPEAKSPAEQLREELVRQKRRLVEGTKKAQNVFESACAMVAKGGSVEGAVDWMAKLGVLMKINGDQEQAPTSEATTSRPIPVFAEVLGDLGLPIEGIEALVAAGKTTLKAVAGQNGQFYSIVGEVTGWSRASCDELIAKLRKYLAELDQTTAETDSTPPQFETNGEPSEPPTETHDGPGTDCPDNNDEA